MTRMAYTKPCSEDFRSLIRSQENEDVILSGCLRDRPGMPKIAETALKEGFGLLTCDKNLAAVMREFGGIVELA